MINIPDLVTIRGNYDILRCTENLSFDSVLDVGLGRGGASLFFKQHGKDVTCIGTNLENYAYPREVFDDWGIKPIEAKLENFEAQNGFDAIWMSHVLEHVMDFGSFLDKTRSLLRDDGWLFITVPPYKPRVVGGHVSTGWNLGQLMYILLLKGFDIKTGHFVTHGYNVCAFVKKSSKSLPDLQMSGRYIEKLTHYWPIPVHQGFNGNIISINWFKGFEVIPDQVQNLPFSAYNVDNSAQE